MKQKDYSILIADDDVTSALLIKKILSNQGYCTETANNGEDALKFLQKNNFHVVLVDWMMPEMDGIELIRRIRKQLETQPYIIMVTALVSQTSVIYAKQTGADDYVIKPIDKNDLIQRVIKGIEKNTLKIF